MGRTCRSTSSYAPGKKPFDFDINQISFTPARAKVVDFSDSYYDVNQAVVVLKGTPIATVEIVAGLKPYKLGAQLGTTSYEFITGHDQADEAAGRLPARTTGAVQALKNKQIDGLVVDLPTAFYVTAVQVPNGEDRSASSRPSAGGEHFGMVFAKGNSLRACVNQALAKLRRRTARSSSSSRQWLAKATGAPVLK